MKLQTLSIYRESATGSVEIDLDYYVRAGRAYPVAVEAFTKRSSTDRLADLTESDWQLIREELPAPLAESWEERTYYIQDDDTGKRRVCFDVHPEDDRVKWLAFVVNDKLHRLDPICATRFRRMLATGEALTFSGHAAETREAQSADLTADLPFDEDDIRVRPLRREEAAERLTQRPGTERLVAFIKRGDRSVRVMRYRFDPEARTSFDARSKGLLPVTDLELGEPRMINLDGVLA